MAEVQDLTEEGLELLAEAFGETTGALLQGSASHAFTGGVVTARRKAPSGGDAEQEEVALLIPASGIDATPAADNRVTLTGDSTVWVVAVANPMAAGGSPWAWSLVLRNWVA